MQKPKSTLGLRHIALYVTHLSACVDFYTQLIGMKIVWQPDEDNVYLTTGRDNFALHRAPANINVTVPQRLDHIGFFLESPEEVDHWHTYMQAHAVDIKAAPKNHRDGTRSFYCADPDGTVVQFIYCPC
jgi:catechol 2,3-dioxygenase-like lactoylglutathione lyase family enzyme